MKTSSELSCRVMRILPRSSCVPYVVVVVVMFERERVSTIKSLSSCCHENINGKSLKHQPLKYYIYDRTHHHTQTQVRNTERVFKNKAAEKVLEIEREHPGDFSKIAHLVRGENYREVFHETGELDEGVWSAGTCMGLIEDIPTCDELTKRIINEAEDILRNKMSSILIN